MPNISLPNPIKSLNISKRLLLVIGGSLALILVLLVSLAVYQRHNDRVAAEDAQKAAVASQAVKANTERIASLESQVKATSDDKAALCTYIKAVQVAKQTRGLITVPSTGHCPN